MQPLSDRYVLKHARAVRNVRLAKPGSRRFSYWFNQARYYRRKAVKTLGMSIP